MNSMLLSLYHFELTQKTMRDNKVVEIWKTFGEPDRHLIPSPIRSFPYHSAEVAIARSILISMWLYIGISSKFLSYLTCLQHLVQLVTYSYLNDFLPLASWTLLSLVTLTSKPLTLSVRCWIHISSATVQWPGLGLQTTSLSYWVSLSWRAYTVSWLK